MYVCINAGMVFMLQVGYLCCALDIFAVHRVFMLSVWYVCFRYGVYYVCRVFSNPTVVFVVVC